MWAQRRFGSPGKYDYARLAAYIPGMRDIVNAQMDRAADFIIRWGTENTTSGNWCVYFEDLEEHLDLTIQEGSGLDSMLRAALKQRPEVSAVDMHDGCIEVSTSIPSLLPWPSASRQWMIPSLWNIQPLFSRRRADVPVP